MQDWRKATHAISFLLTAVLVLSLRGERFSLIVGSVVMLLAVSLLFRSRVAVSGLIIGGIFWYPSAQWGWLVGRDTHSAANTARLVRDVGWPAPSGVVATDFVSTPLVHLSAAVTSVVSGLDIMPGVRGKILVTAVLPIVYLGVAYLIVYCLARRYAEHVGRGNATFAMVSITLWTHTYYIRSAFRRPSIAIVVFTVAVFSYHRLIRTRQARWLALGGLSTGALILAHHFASVLFVALAVIGTIVIAVTRLAIPFGVSGRFSVKSAGMLSILGAVFLSSWYVFSNRGSQGVLFIAFNAQSAGGAVKSYPNSLTPTFFDLFARTYSKFLFCAVLSIPILSYVIIKLKDREIPRLGLIVTAWGVIIAGVAGVSLFTSLELGTGRILSYFVVAGAAMSLPALDEVFSQSRINSSHVQVIIILCLVILSMIAIPPSSISDTETDLARYPSDQRYGSSFYATAEFIQYVPNNTTLVGDADTAELTEPVTNRRVSYSTLPYQNSTVERDSVVVYRDLNERTYTGRLEGSFRTLRTLPDGAERLGANVSKIYATGNESVYVK